MNKLLKCRACDADNPYLFLPMGDHPPANMFVKKEDLGNNSPAFELNTQVCLECGLIQVADQIDKDFFRHYLYVPSGASTMHTHFSSLADVLVAEADTGLIVDIGCNDGLLLSACNAIGGRTLGIDPAANLAEIALERGVKVHVDYFSPHTAENVRAEHGRAKAIVTTNTFNHIGDLHSFTTGVRDLLAADGVFVIEVPRALDLLNLNEFDTVYHEHVSEFSLLSIVKLGAAHGLDVVDVHRLPVHGGSMRVFLRPTESNTVPAPIVDEMLAEERKVGMHDAETYDAFAQRIQEVRTSLITMLTHLKGEGLKLAGYGAPAKGNTLLNYFQIGPDLIDFLVDRNPLKHGLYSPGMNIPIKSTDAICAEKPDVLLVLAWNFFDEIRDQQAEFVSNGGRFLVPLPYPTLTT